MKTRDKKRMAKQLLKCKIESRKIQTKEECEGLMETAIETINGKYCDKREVYLKVCKKYKEFHDAISRKQSEIETEYKSKCDYKGGEKVMYCFFGRWREGVVMDMELTYWSDEIITIMDKRSRKTNKITYERKNVKLKK